ncbi:MAG: IS91 family transposase [Acidobacteria bacterium]|nr:IS91 family transposase [Acidobacteriota bacterium]
MNRPTLELADIFRQHGAAYRQRHRLPRHHLRVMRAIEICRTATLGGHVEQCNSSGQSCISYHSCRNRHCLKCGSLARARWLQQRQAELLPVPYFHVVFTVPQAIAELALQSQRLLYDLLFRLSTTALLTIARDPLHLGAEVGFFGILHTWGQNLLHHPHVHYVVPGGGLAPDHDRWIPSRRRNFLLPVRVLSTYFRHHFLLALDKLHTQGKLTLTGTLSHLHDPARFARYLDDCRRRPWVVNAKPPFGGPQQALEYLRQYTHRAAISNRRLVSLDSGTVTFRWKDYRHGQTGQLMTLAVDEFIRRFLLHVLPDGFQRIRFGGFLANRHRRTKLARLAQLLSLAVTDLLPPPSALTASALLAHLTGQAEHQCPFCQQGRLVRVQTPSPIR